MSLKDWTCMVQLYDTVDQLMSTIPQLRGDLKIPHSRMTKTCWETLVTYL